MSKNNNQKPIICLITGPAGAGKTSVSKALSKKLERSVVINVDELRHMIIGGYIKPWPWNEEVKVQTSLGVKNACMLANNFFESGFNVIIDDVIGKTFFKLYSEFLSNKPVKIFLLLPTLEALLKRFDQRGVDEELRKRTPELHEKFTKRKDEFNWQVIDSSNQTLEETANQIFNELVN
jgi:thymidylate kinase